MHTKKTRSLFRLFPVVLIAAATLFIPSALAVHNEGLFELDIMAGPPAQGAANVADQAAAGDDWATVFAGADSAAASTFIEDGTDPDDKSYFTGGGSKDVRDVSDWMHTVTDQAPDKDEIIDAFAAAYTASDGDSIFYFGLDRFAVDGDAQVGFWFFKNSITELNPGADGGFSGVHAVGDILVLSDFVQGGKVGRVAVYEWVGGSNPLDLLFASNAADCSVAAANDPACAVVNNVSGENPPWNYVGKAGGPDGNTATYEAGALYEGGINLNQLLGGSIGCFSSFLAETRSSQSTSAQLKDYALGSFAVCDIDVSKTGDALSKVGDPADYTITISNPGGRTLFKKNISDDVLGAITLNGVDQANPNVLTNGCGASLAAGASCTITLRRTVQPGDPDPLVNTVSIVYTEGAGPSFSGAALTASDGHSVNLFQPSVDITKSGTALSKIGDSVTYDFTIANTSSADSPNLLLDSLSDTLLGDLSDEAPASCDSLAPGASCSFSVNRTVLAGDPDPLGNTVTAHYHPAGFPNDISDSDSHSVNLFQPSVVVIKGGDALSKAGDSVTYEFTITNTSSADSPNLVLDSINDTLLGDLSDEAPAACDTLAPGAFCTFTAQRTVLSTDFDPLENTVTVHYHPTGFGNDISDSDDHSVNLFQPSVTIDKTGTTLSKVGDDVTYGFLITNTSSADSPNLVLDSINDTLLGDLSDEAPAACDSLAPGGSCSFSVDRTVLASDPDPLNNTVTVHYHPQGFPNDISDSDDHSVNLFVPGLTVDKTGDELSKVGDQVTYDFFFSNTGSPDSADLILDSVSDTVLGDLTAEATAAGCDSLAPGESCSFSVDYTIQAGANDPLVNTVTAHYHPMGFPNDVFDSDEHSVNLFQPAVTVVKEGDTLSKIGDQVTYDFMITNSGSADSPALVLDSINDTVLGDLADEAPAACDSLAAGASCSFSVDYTIQAGAPDPLVNTVTVHYHPDGFPNDISDSDSHSVNLFQPGLNVDKSGTELSKVGDEVTYDFVISNTGSADSATLMLDSVTDSLLGSLTSTAAENGCGSLAPGASCSFTVNRTVLAGDADPLVNTVDVHYHPAGFTNDISDTDSHSVNLFQPAVTVVKAGDTLSKIGDPVTYSFTITNSGSADSPALVLDSISDTLLGNLAAAANAAGCGSLAPAASCNFTVDRTVQAGDPDPLGNTVTVHYHPDGFPNDITDSDDHSVNLFQPSVTINKTGDELSKVGDAANYTITVRNTSSSDSPNLTCTITDALLGINAEVNLAPGAEHVINDSRTVESGDPDPLVNTARVDCTVDGFGNVLPTASDSHSVNLFQPAVTVVKTGPASATDGDTITYNFTITNSGSSDSPNLILDSISDTVLGDLADEAPATCDSLAAGASCSFSVNYTIKASDPDPLVNVVTVHYHPQGFPNDISDSDDHSVEVEKEQTQLAHTQTTCEDFLAGAEALTEITYGLRRGVIGNVSPGVFFFYAEYSVTGSQQTLVVDAAQRFNAANGSLTNDFVIQNDQSFLYFVVNGVCQKVTENVTMTNIGGAGQVQITYDPAGSAPVPQGTYVLGVKYTNASSLIGQAPCHGLGATCRYYFIPSRDGSELTQRAQFFTFRRR